MVVFGLLLTQDSKAIDPEPVKKAPNSLNEFFTNSVSQPGTSLQTSTAADKKPSAIVPDPPGSAQATRSSSDLPSKSSTKNGLVPCSGTDCTLEKLKDMGANIYNFLAGLGALVAVGVIVMAGFSYISSRGDAGKMKEAKEKITYAIIGLIVLGVSVLLVNTVLKVFGAKDVKNVESIQSK